VIDRPNACCGPTDGLHELGFGGGLAAGSVWVCGPDRQAAGQGLLFSRRECADDLIPRVTFVVRRRGRFPVPTESAGRPMVMIERIAGKDLWLQRSLTLPVPPCAPFPRGSKT